MTTRYDLMTGKADKDGKKRWTRIGVMFPSKQGEGFSIKLEALPLPNAEGEVWISAFVPREREEGSGRSRQDSAPSGGGRLYSDLDDDVPFMREDR